MVSFDKVQAGDILFDVKTVKMGNTTMTQRVAYRVRVVSVHEDYAMISWNSNQPQKYYRGTFSRLVRTPPKGTGERKSLDATKARASA